MEKNLVKLYSKYFEIEYKSDDKKYADFDKKRLFPDVIENVKSNFKNFGWYHTVLNLESIFEEAEIATGDAIDDLSDIIYGLLEVKWRKENNSNDDAYQNFELIFYSHTQQHLINLLHYMKTRT